MAFQNDSIFWVEVEKIVPNPFQPRREFDESKLKELAESVRMYGILQPLTVTRKEIQTEDGAFYSEYELIAGERRLRASKIAGLSQVPVIIREGEDNEQEKLELAIIENLQREDLNAVDRALAFRQLADSFGLSHAQVAKKVGRSREYVSNTLRLLMLPEYMLDSLKIADITEGHARTLLMLNDRPEEQDTLYREILLKKLSVREVERIARKIAQDKVRSKKWKDTDPELIELEKQFTETLGTRVQIAKTDYGGKVTIDYFSPEDLDHLLNLMQPKQGAPTTAGAAVTASAVAAAAADSEQLSNEALEHLRESSPLEPAEVVKENTDLKSTTEPNALTTLDQAEVETEQPEPEVTDAPLSETETAPTDKAESITPDEEPISADEPVQSETSDEPDVSTSKSEDSQTNEPEKSPDDESDLYAIRNFGV